MTIKIFGDQTPVRVPTVGTYSEFHISEVGRWTRTPILADIGTFVVPLSTYILQSGADVTAIL